MCEVGLCVTFHGKNTLTDTQRKRGKKTKFNTAKWKIIKHTIFYFPVFVDISSPPTFRVWINVCGMYTGDLHQAFFFMLDLSFLLDTLHGKGWWAAILLAEEWVSPYKHSKQQSSPVWAGFHFQGIKCFSVSPALLFVGLQELFTQQLTLPQDKR